MLNFLQNLEYYMTFEVLEPNWEGMITKIRSGKVTNVDQVSLTNVLCNRYTIDDSSFLPKVLEIHSDFLSTCLNDCMLSNPELLTTVKKLLGVCVDFADFLKDFAKDDRAFDLMAMGAGNDDRLEAFHQEVSRQVKEE